MAVQFENPTHFSPFLKLMGSAAVVLRLLEMMHDALTQNLTLTKRLVAFVVILHSL
jgi:hypothetical protein